MPRGKKGWETLIYPVNPFALQRVNFTNILQASFTHLDPKSAKKTVKLSSFFALWGSARVKAVCKTLVKLTTDFCFTSSLFGWLFGWRRSPLRCRGRQPSAFPPRGTAWSPLSAVPTSTTSSPSSPSPTSKAGIRSRGKAVTTSG